MRAREKDREKEMKLELSVQNNPNFKVSEEADTLIWDVRLACKRYYDSGADEDHPKIQDAVRKLRKYIYGLEQGIKVHKRESSAI
jgi:hypothetical protein